MLHGSDHLINCNWFMINNGMHECIIFEFEFDSIMSKTKVL